MAASTEATELATSATGENAAAVEEDATNSPGVLGDTQAGEADVQQQPVLSKNQQKKLAKKERYTCTVSSCSAYFHITVLCQRCA